MTDVTVTPWRTGWTVRHDRILFERFDTRDAALRRAREVGRLMQSRGEPSKLRCPTHAKTEA